VAGFRPGIVTNHRPALDRCRSERIGQAGPADTDETLTIQQPGRTTLLTALPAAEAPRVLLVDDNSGMRRVLRGLLEDAGMVVVGEAADGLEGVAQAADVRPDVVLMDWRMPRLDGVQATARIRSQLPEIQVVVFSSAEGAGMGVIARQAGASAFVAKGASPEQVCAAVKAAWRRPPPSAPPIDGL
jgi:CheY-like chemotaxis protein